MKFFGHHNKDDLIIAVIAGILAWVLTLALRAAFHG
jgi:hypothetical protein